MGRFLALLYGVVAYLVFLAAFLYAIAFVGNVLVFQSILGDVFVLKYIDAGGASATFGTALLINTVLLGLFAAQHNIMARPAFKEKWTKIVPESVERSTYVLASSLLLLLLFSQWRPMTNEVWSVGGIGATVLTALFWLGWVIVLASTVLINHFELFGLRQVFLNFKQQEPTHAVFRTPLLYKLVRHPLMLGFIVAFWAAPTMTQGHLVFAIITTVWILGTIRLLEEPDLVEIFGDTYRQYQNDVNMIIPIPKMGGGGDATAISTPEPMAAVPEPIAAAPEPEPEAVAAEPEPIAATAESEPVAAAPEPEPVAAEPEPEPVTAEPEPIAATPEPEPVAAEPEPMPSGMDDPPAGLDVSGQAPAPTTLPESDTEMDDPSVPEPGTVLTDDDEDDRPTPTADT